jgi:membrane-associated phospholipid phosphatase
MGADLMSRTAADSRCLTNALAFAFLLGGASVLALSPDWLDRPAARAINSLTTGWQFANELAFALAYPTVQGVIVVSLIWYCWFSDITTESRARLVSGTCAAVLAGLIAHFLREALPTSPRPIVDPLLKLHLPDVLGDIDGLQAIFYPDSHRFPSDRATMFAGLAIAILLVRHKVGLLALACTMMAEGSRIYLGLHYPADIIGSFSLAAAVVWLAQMRWGSRLGLQFVGWEATSAATFYMCIFFASYQLATAFQEMRDLAAQFLR